MARALALAGLMAPLLSGTRCVSPCPSASQAHVLTQSFLSANSVPAPSAVLPPSLLNQTLFHFETFLNLAAPNGSIIAKETIRAKFGDLYDAVHNVGPPPFVGTVGPAPSDPDNPVYARSGDIVKPAELPSFLPHLDQLLCGMVRCYRPSWPPLCPTSRPWPWHIPQPTPICDPAICDPVDPGFDPRPTRTPQPTPNCDPAICDPAPLDSPTQTYVAPPSSHPTWSPIPPPPYPFCPLWPGFPETLPPLLSPAEALDELQALANGTLLVNPAPLNGTDFDVLAIAPDESLAALSDFVTLWRKEYDSGILTPPPIAARITTEEPTEEALDKRAKFSGSFEVDISAGEIMAIGAAVAMVGMCAASGPACIIAVGIAAKSTM
jgi:hypothetical protein